MDNSDERQQTLTGLNTTHHTNATVYSPKNEETSTTTQEIIDDNQEQGRPSGLTIKLESLHRHQLLEITLTILTLTS